MLKTVQRQYYKVKEGQTLREVADYFCVSERLLVKENSLTGELFAGQILKIPAQKGNVYTVREGDTKELLCGNAKAFEEKNGTADFYIGMKVIL